MLCQKDLAISAKYQNILEYSISNGKADRDRIMGW